ncbi:hypothetical protein [Amphibacillus jilinensis]|uniref:hypothetical protein n=1 Tax=Amphibacillus jilinensis TaxID=1216008 RepID=UPI0003155F56|nr:hypothetical protein [Amphibacillus jilinensis]
MIEALLDFALGPFGRSISQFYIDHQFLFNSIVVGSALIFLFRKYNHKSAD